MNWKQALHLVVLAEVLNYRKAAERLHMAQPPLSMSIKRLEEELGAPLFWRERRGLRLTPVGEAVLPHARQIVFHVDQLKSSAASARQGVGGHLRIGFVGSATYRLLPRALPEFRSRFPGVQLHLREGTTTEILRQVERGDLDLGLVRYPVVEACAVRLVPVELDRLVVAVPDDGPLSGQRTLRLNQLADYPVVMYAAGAAANLRSQVVSVCQSVGFTPRVVQEAVQVQTLLSLVASGMGVALVPSASQAHRIEGIRYRALADTTPQLDVAIAAATHPAAEPAVATQFLALMRGMSDQGRPGCPLIAPGADGAAQ